MRVRFPNFSETPRKKAPNSRDERVADGAITSVVEESLGNIVLTQTYNRGRAPAG